MLDEISRHIDSVPMLQSFPPSLNYPLLAKPEVPESTPTGLATSSQVPSAIVIIRLLDRAAKALHTDHATAHQSIARASALLRGEYGGAYTARGGLAPWQARRVTTHINTFLAATIRAHDCARIARLSTSHFSRAFKASFGETFFKYVIRRRTERAQELMVTTDEPLSQIALNCGFADQPHLSRNFRALVGATPAAWRRQRREGSVAP